MEILQTLLEAHDAIKKYIKRNELDTARALLEECQQSALQIGETIEESEGGEHPAVLLLEAYCERLYQVSIGIPEEISVQKAQKLLDGTLMQAKASVEKDIAVRKEVVFLPYKASMWDSLESVWRAANADPTCDAYVIPIPYYDKNPDGSFRELHYEGGQYPKDVPVIWYKDYDFASRRPDIVFIHNPYDECNFVTTVEPFFYTKNLKKFTEKLVYIPYFVLEEIHPDDDAAGQEIEHFCASSGVFFSDMTIVQSEDMRQAYINILVNKFGEQTRLGWEQKILGLGSPKFDKIQSTKLEDITVPKDWLKIIQKPDGSWKKIILYNTSVTALLEHSDKMLDKIRYVLRIFKDNQDEAALLWRPHPLIQATIESMRPQLWLEYQRIVKQYRTEGWGIYDDSSDMNRALELCDAYYGDPSSVAHLCENSGKPVMIQNSKVKNMNHPFMRCFPVWATHFCIDERSVWFVHGKINVLMKYDMSKGELEIIGKIPGEKSVVGRTYISIKKRGHRIFLIPALNKNICVFDTLTRQFTSCKIRGISGDNFPLSFINAYIYGNYIYCIPCYYKHIVRINTESLEIEYLSPVQKTGISPYLQFTSASLRWRENIIIGTRSGSNELFLYDMAEDRLMWKKLPLDDAKITALTSDGEFLYINDYNNQRILKYSIDQDAVSGAAPVPFSRVSLTCLLNGDIIIDPLNEKCLYVMGRDGSLICHDKNRSHEEYALAYDYCNGILYERYMGKQYLFDRNESVLYEVQENGQVREYSFILTYAQTQVLAELACENPKQPLEENEFCSIDYLLKVCTGIQRDAPPKQASRPNIGADIWKAILPPKIESKDGGGF